MFLVLSSHATSLQIKPTLLKKIPVKLWYFPPAYEYKEYFGNRIRRLFDADRTVFVTD
jgi:hypothetical protein